jgi:surface antigen
MTEGKPERAVFARRRSFSGRAEFSAMSCMWCVVLALLVILFEGASIAAARPAPLPVLVRASFSNRGGTPTVQVSIRSAAGATCRLTVGVSRHSVSFPEMIADARGRVVVSWQVPARAPGGYWAFDVSCAQGQRAGRGSDQAAVLVRGGKGAGQLVASSSSQLVQGDLVATGLRVRADSYARSCSADVCFADDPLWRTAGESAWYVVGRRPDLDGIVGASAGDWLKEARGRVPEGTIPLPGAVAVWLPNTGGASGAGHVAYVVGVSGARVLVDDSNWGEPGLRVQRHLVPASWISGYIYGRLAGRGPDAAVSTPPPPAAGVPNSPNPDTPPPLVVGVPGGPGPGSPPEGSPPEVPGVPGEPPSGSESSPSGNPLEATLPSPPTIPEPASLESILPQARQIMAQSGTVWSKAAAVRNLVRASLSDQNDCGIMATAFWSVGSIVGLPVRLVNSSANGQNAFDTHSTVEVWLAGLGRWAISDPTFNGYWTAGPEGPPVSAEFIQSALSTDTNSMLYWHGAGTPNSILPSQYYVDPTYLYSYTEFLAFVPSLGSGFMVDSEADAYSVPYALVPTTSTDFESLPPTAQTPITVDQRAEAPSSAGVSNFTLPPRYANALVYEGQVTIGSDGRAVLPVTDSGPAMVVSVDTNAGNWQIEVGGGTVYDLDPYPGARVSPMIFLGSPVYLITSGVVPGPVTVSIWNVKDFPPSREVTSQWEGA